MARTTRATARSSLAKTKVTHPLDRSYHQCIRAPPEYSVTEAAQRVRDPAGVRGSIFGPETLRSHRLSIAGDQHGQTGPTSPCFDPIYPGGRRFSALYGRGHPLEHNLFPAESVTGQKRKASDHVEEISPKKVRFAPASNEEELRRVDIEIQAQPDEDLCIAQQDLVLDAEFLCQPDMHLLTALSDVTVTLSISQISSMFRILQKLTGHFAATYFAHATQDKNDIVGVDMQTFPFADLELKHHSLYLTTVNVLDASTTDKAEGQSQLKNTEWLKFFAHPNYRPFLVTAILSEWFTQRIFKDTAFGLSDKAHKELSEGVDKRYIHFDSFIRAKRRSAVVARHRKKDDAEECLIKASRGLAHELMVVLAPMLPFYKPSDLYNDYLSPSDAEQGKEIYLALSQLIQHCAAVNLAVVRSGENGTIVRPANRLEKGKQYFPTAPMECINPALVGLTRDDTKAGKNERLTIKMTCWPRMEAWVPHGIDKWEMSLIEENERTKQLPFYLRTKIQRDEELTPEELKRVRKSFSWNKTDMKMWDVLPVELWNVDKKNRDKQDMLRKLNENQKRSQRTQRKNDGGDDGSDSSDSDSSERTNTSSKDAEDDNEIPEEEGPCGSWVTDYTCLAPHTVYCEWTKPERPGANRAALRPTNSLQSAIREARKNLPSPHFYFAKADDLLLKIWNFYASHNLAIEWGTFLIAVLVFVSRRGISDNTASMLAVPLKFTARILNGVREFLSVQGLGPSPASLTNIMSHGLSDVGSKFYPNHLSVPVHMLDNANSYLRNNMAVFKIVLRNMLAPLASPLSSAAVHGKLAGSEGLASITQFIGQRKPSTTNAVNGFAAVSPGVVSQPSRTVGPAVAASLASVASVTSAASAAASTAAARITPPPALSQNSWVPMGSPDPEAFPPDSEEETSGVGADDDDETSWTPEDIEDEVNPWWTAETITETETRTIFDLPTATPTSTPNMPTPPPQQQSLGIWHAAVSRVANVAGNFMFETPKRGRTRTVGLGETVTKTMAHGDYRVI